MVVNPISGFGIFTVVLRLGVEIMVRGEKAVPDKAKEFFQNNEGIAAVVQIMVAGCRKYEGPAVTEEILARGDTLFRTDQVLQSLCHQNAIKAGGLERRVRGISGHKGSLFAKRVVCSPAGGFTTMLLPS